MKEESISRTKRIYFTEKTNKIQSSAIHPLPHLVPHHEIISTSISRRKKKSKNPAE